MAVPTAVTTTIEIVSVGATNADRGTTRMEVKIPELGFRDFPTPLFVDATDASNMNPGQSYLVKLVQGSLKKEI